MNKLVNPELKQLREENKELLRLIKRQNKEIAKLEQETIDAHKEWHWYLKKRFERHLTPREQWVVEMRHGLVDGVPKTLAFLAENLGVSVSRAQGIYDKSKEVLNDDVGMDLFYLEVGRRYTLAKDAIKWKRKFESPRPEIGYTSPDTQC